MTPNELERATWDWEDEFGEAAAGYAMSMEQRRQLVRHVDATLYFTPNGDGVRDYKSFMGRPIIDLHTAAEITILSQAHLEQLRAERAKTLPPWAEKFEANMALAHKHIKP